MNWILFAVTSYFFGALTVILDKYLLGSKRIVSPATYGFYVGTAGVAVLFFAPLGFFYPAFRIAIPSLNVLFFSLISGVFFMAGLVALYYAIQKSEASKVTPIVFSTIPLVTFGLSLLWGNEKISTMAISGVLILILGGLLISFDLPLKIKKEKFFAGFYLSLLSGFLQAISLLALKIVYLEQGFFSGYVWTRVGALVGACLLLALPIWRKSILLSMSQAGDDKKKNIQTGFLFALNKILGGSGSALINLAIKAGSVTLITSMISLQYVFVLIIAATVGRKLPNIFEERLLFWDWAQKIVAIAIIAVGLVLIMK